MLQTIFGVIGLWAVIGGICYMGNKLHQPWSGISAIVFTALLAVFVFALAHH